MTLTDDDILSLWRTARPSEGQTAVMTWVDHDDPAEDRVRPMWELRRLVELAVEYGRTKGGEG